MRSSGTAGGSRKPSQRAHDRSFYAPQAGVTDKEPAEGRFYGPVFSKLFVDRFLAGRDLEWTVPFLIFLSTFALIQIVLSAMQAVYNLKMQGKLAIKANAVYMWHVLRMPVEFFTQRHAEDIAIRKRDNEILAATLINTLAPTVLDLLMMIVYLIYFMKI